MKSTTTPLPPPPGEQSQTDEGLPTAADEIEKLRVENERLRGALRVELSAVTDADVEWAIDALAEQPDEPTVEQIRSIIWSVTGCSDGLAKEAAEHVADLFSNVTPPPPGEQSQSAESNLQKMQIGPSQSADEGLPTAADVRGILAPEQSQSAGSAASEQNEVSDWLWVKVREIHHGSLEVGNGTGWLWEQLLKLPKAAAKRFGSPPSILTYTPEDQEAAKESLRILADGQSTSDDLEQLEEAALWLDSTFPETGDIQDNKLTQRAHGQIESVARLIRKAVSALSDERARIVAYIRREWINVANINDIIDAIERGVHLPHTDYPTDMQEPQG